MFISLFFAFKIMHINKACINAFEKGQQKLRNEENACMTFIKKYRAYIGYILRKK